MNKNYVRGRAKEYRLKKKYGKLGYVVLRTAGSHGFADLIAIGTEIRFIQVKPKKFSDGQKLKLLKENAWINHKEKRCWFVVE